MFGKDSSGKASLTVLFGILGVASPFVAIHAATFMGRSDISLFNSSMLLFLSVLLMIFLIINSFHNFLENNKKTFLIGILLLLLTLISFIFNLSVYMTL